MSSKVTRGMYKPCEYKLKKNIIFASLSVPWQDFKLKPKSITVHNSQSRIQWG